MSCSDTPSQVAKTLGLTAIKHRSGISATVIMVQIGGKLLSAMQGRGSIFAAPTLKLLIAICPMSKFQEFKYIYMYQKTCGNMNVKIQSWPYDLMNDMETNTHWLSSSIHHRLLQGNICISRCVETIISWDYQMIQKWTVKIAWTRSKYQRVLYYSHSKNVPDSPTSYPSSNSRFYWMILIKLNDNVQPDLNYEFKSFCETGHQRDRGWMGRSRLKSVGLYSEMDQHYCGTSVASFTNMCN